MLLTFCYCLLLIFVQSSAFFDVDEIISINYGIDILDSPVMAGQEDTEETGSLVFLTSKFGQQYQCSYLDQSQGLNRREKEEEKVAMEKGIIDLLKPMEGGSCLTLTKGWWTYEFCYKKHIKQYHVEDGAILGNVLYLGHFHTDFDWSNTTQTKKPKAWVPRYHSQEYVNGSECDLTGKGRRAQVKFFCEQSQGDYISRVDETETCVYTISVQTPRICHHPYLKPPTKTKAVPITCQPLLTAEEYAEYEEMKAEEEKEEKEALMREKVVATSDEVLDPFLKKQLSKDEWSSDVDTDVDGDDDDLDTTTEAFQDLIAESLVAGLKDVFGGEDAIKVTKFKSKAIKQGDVDSMIKEILTKVNSQTDEDGETIADDSSIDELAITEDKKDVKEKDEDDDDEDDALSDFDKGLDDIAESNEHLQELKKYKDSLQHEMTAQFSEILREAEQELNDAGFREEVDRDAALKTMSNTLEKLLKQLEEKQITGNTKAISAMIEKAAASILKKDVTSHKEARTDAEEARTDEEEFGEDTVEEQALYKEQKEEQDVTAKEEEDDDMISVEYDIQYGDKHDDSNSPQSQTSTSTSVDSQKVDATKQTAESTKSNTVVDSNLHADGIRKSPKSYVKNFNYHQSAESSEARDVDELSENSEYESESDTLQFSTEKSADGKYERTYYTDGDVKIKITTRHKPDNTEYTTETEVLDSETSLDESSEISLEQREIDNKAEKSPKLLDAVKRGAEKKVQDLVQSKLKDAGVKLSDQKIQVKIFTTDDYYSEGGGAKELLQTSGVLNKMLVAVLGGNSDELKEADRQEKLENNYGFVWSRSDKKKSSASKPTDD